MLPPSVAFEETHGQSPFKPIASDRKSPEDMQSSRNSSKPVSAPAPNRCALPHNSARGAIRIDARSGSSSGSPSAICCARRQLLRAAAKSRLASHVPARRCQLKAPCEISRRLQMLGDQRRILVGRCGVTGFDSSGQTSMQFRTVRLELRFVGDRANQGMAERVLLTSAKPHLLNQFRLDERCHVHDVDRVGQQLARRIATRSRLRRRACVWPQRSAGRCGRRWWPAGSQARRHHPHRHATQTRRAPRSVRPVLPGHAPSLRRRTGSRPHEPTPERSHPPAMGDRPAVGRQASSFVWR